MMFFNLGKHGPDGKYGVVIDIGSGSVGIAIIASDIYEKNPLFIWHARERMPIRSQNETTEIIKHISTTILNAFLRFGSEGIKALQEYENGANVSDIQISISAPWAFTVAKTIIYTSDKTFVITKKLIKQLTKKAYEQALKTLEDESILKKNNLKLVNQKTIHLRANGYKIKNPIGESSNSLEIAHLTTVTYKKITDIIEEANTKVLSNTPTKIFSFMQLFYAVVQDLNLHVKELCLIDITYETTEVGFIRDGILSYVSHTPFGTYTLARAIAYDCKVPEEEAFGYMKNSDIKKDEQKVNEIYRAYEDDLADLFTKSDDKLTIPHTIFLHADHMYEDFTRKRIENAAKKVTKGDHVVHMITSRLLSEKEEGDTALLLSANFFHTQRRTKL